MTSAFSQAAQERIPGIIARYAEKRGALLPLLWLAQEEWGWLSPEALTYCASLLDLPPSKAYSVASFYTMYHLKPVGKYKIEVCRTLSCALCGAMDIIDHLESRLGIKVGETTADGRFTLGTAECLASCGSGPMLQINGKRFHEHLTTASVDALLNSLP